MKSNICVFIGSGDLATRSAGMLVDLGLSLVGVCRNPSVLPPIFKGIEADYTRAGDLNFLESLEPDFLIVTFKPLKPDFDGYKQGFVDAANNLVDGLGKHMPSLIIFVSSTRVFAENEGGWVNEHSARTKTDRLGNSIIEAEDILIRAGFPLTTLYCSGLYGSSMDYLVERVKQGVFSAQSCMNVSNRIHREDVAGILAWLTGLRLNKEHIHKSYVVSDSCPVERRDVELWLAERLNLTFNVRVEDRNLVIRGGNKRCDNNLLVKSGYKLLYPDYKSGFEAILRMEDN